MSDTLKPDARLLAVAKFVRGDYPCDVGTDHAILPIYLCKTGKASHAIASDVNRGPLLSAEKNIRGEGLSDKITTVLSNGLEKLGEYSPTDIIVAGMGGILISEIISASEAARRAHLVLQPMTHAHVLRKFLTENGFSIEDETVAEESGKIYQIISASHTGKSEKYTPTELYLGKKNIENREKNPLFEKLLDAHIATFAKKVRGGDTSAETLYGEMLALKGEKQCLL